METNPIPALLSALQAAGLTQFVAYGPVVIAVAAVLAAVLPHPANDSPWVPFRRLLDLLALNVGAAKNAASGGAGGQPGAAALAAVMVSSLSLAACSASQNAAVTANLQAASAVAAQDIRLFCAVATPAGPLVVSVADAAGAPVVATGAAKAVVDATCSAVNGIAVSPPPVGTLVPSVATSSVSVPAQQS